MSSLRVALRLSKRETERREEEIERQRSAADRPSSHRARHRKQDRRTSHDASKPVKIREPPLCPPNYGYLDTLDTTSKRIRIVIVGGGVAGLSAARILAQKGVREAKFPIDVTILEARKRFGGRILTERLKDDTFVDLGASFVHGCNSDNPTYNVAKRLKVCLHTAHGGYSQGWSTGPWYDEDGTLITAKTVKRLEKIHDSIREDMKMQSDAIVSKSMSNVVDTRSDISIGTAFEKASLKRWPNLSPRTRRLLQSKNVLAWCYAASPSNVSLRAYYDIQDDLISGVNSRTIRRGRQPCAHISELSDEDIAVPETEKLRRILFEEDCALSSSTSSSSTERWFCLHCRRVFLDKPMSGASRSKRRPLANARFVHHMHMCGHPLMLSLRRLSCWCGSCGRFLLLSEHPLLNRFVAALHLAKYGCELSEVKSPADEDMRIGLAPTKVETVRTARSAGTGGAMARPSTIVSGSSMRIALKRSLEPSCDVLREKKKTKKKNERRAPSARARFLRKCARGSKRKQQAWVRCDRCKKWRKAEKSAENFKGKWFCEMNTWDPGRASCDSPYEGEADLSDGFVVDGYRFLVEWLIRECGVAAADDVDAKSSGETAPCDARLGVVAREIHHGSRATTCVKTACGEVFDADYVVVALPLPVLQSKHQESAVRFFPALSDAKQSSISKLGMGAENKAVLRWSRENIFWPTREPYIQTFDPRMRIINADYFGRTTGVLVVHMSPPFSRGYAGLSDSEVVREILSVLSKMFFLRSESTSQSIPQPVETRVTRWEEDVYAGGSYSYLPVGASNADIERLAAPEGRLLFAGEACSVEGHQCVHGAYSTGEAAGYKILESITRAIAKRNYGADVESASD